ncbi:MAG TPA: hypothetical protein VMS17_18165 [Gemmataceae bacterium]|nr:hypothetical protein [Gemmataceae bacterium]
MLRVVAAMFGVAVMAACARAADTDPFVGSWQVDHDGYREIWTIAKDKDDYTVNGVFNQNGAEVGSFKGADVKVADGKLTCSQNWIKKPEPTWSDSTKLTATVKGDKLSFTWDNGNGQSGTRDMARAKAVANDGSDLIGVWKSDHDGYTEVLEIRMVKGAWAAGGSFLKKGKLVGAWSGADVAFADGKLSCTQKYTAKPEATWSDGNKLTAQIDNDKLIFTWDNGSGQSGTHEMTKVSK